MAGRKDIEAGKAYVLLYLKNTVGGGLQSAGRQITAFGATMTAAGAAIVTPLAAAVAHFTRFGSELADMSARTGQSAGSLAELKFAAEQTGATLADVETAIKKQQKGGLGSNFDRVAANIAAIEDPAKRTQAAIEAWGRSGTKLLPMVKNLQALRQEARDLGLVPTEEAVAMADQLGDSFDKVKSVFSATVFEIGAALAPMLLPALDIVKQIAVSVGKWARENGQLFRTIALIGGSLLAAGTLITGFGVGLTLAGAALSGIVTLAGILFSPAGLIIGGLTAAIVLWARYSAAGQRAMRAIHAAFIPIFDAIAGGDLTLAWNVALKGMEVSFRSFVVMIESIWLGFVNWMKNTMIDFANAAIIQINERIGTAIPLLAHGEGAKPTASAAALLKALGELVDLNARAAAARKRMELGAVGAVDPFGLGQGRESITAQTAAGALALQFGPGGPQDIPKQTLQEIREMRKSLFRQEQMQKREEFRDRRARWAR